MATTTRPGRFQRPVQKANVLAGQSADRVQVSGLGRGQVLALTLIEVSWPADERAERRHDEQRHGQ